MADGLRKFLKEVQTAGNVTEVLLSDSGKEFNCEVVQKVLEEHGITHRLAMAYTPKKNGAAEQESRTIVEGARSMLHVSGLPKEMWAEACNTAVYILNRTGSTPVKGKMPFCRLNRMQLLATCVMRQCYVHIPK